MEPSHQPHGGGVAVRVLIWGSRSLTWKHLHLFEDIAWHAVLANPWPLADFIHHIHLSPAPKEGGPDFSEVPRVTLLNGDGPPGRSVPGAIGADHLAVFACMRKWHRQESRSIRWHRPESLQAKQPGLSWAQAAAMRDVAMAQARPERAYCVHTDLDSSRGSIITANALTELGLPFWYVRCSAAGELLEVQLRGGGG